MQLLCGGGEIKRQPNAESFKDYISKDLIIQCHVKPYMHIEIWNQLQSNLGTHTLSHNLASWFSFSVSSCASVLHPGSINTVTASLLQCCYEFNKNHHERWDGHWTSISHISLVFMWFGKVKTANESHSTSPPTHLACHGGSGCLIDVDLPIGRHENW
jgi:hypothetical protein